MLSKSAPPYRRFRFVVVVEGFTKSIFPCDNLRMGRNIDEIPPLELLVIQSDYEARKITVPELRKKHNLSDIGLRTLMTREGWELRRRPNGMAPKNPVGRPRIYDPDIHPEWAKGFFMLGWTWKRVSEAMRIPEKTLKDWAGTYSEFSDAVNFGRSGSDVDVVESLYNRAIGYAHKEEKIFCHQGHVTRVETRKYYAPDVRAQEIYLSRRRPEVWRESKNVDVTDRTLRREVPANFEIEIEADFEEVVAGQLEV